MSEKIIHPEEKANHEVVNDHYHDYDPYKNEQALEQARKEQSEVNLTKLREHATSHAEEASTVNAKHHTEKAPQISLGSQHALKQTSFEQTIKQVQSKLKGTDKAFSKVVHNKSIDKLSNIGSSTIARPSGILGGSISAFLGSSILLFTAKHYGFSYNYLLLILLFVIGFLIGSSLELIIWATYYRNKK